MSDPKPTGDDAAQAGDQPSRPDEWIGFEAAAKLIDGPDGWWYDHAKQNRPRAEALLHLAYLGRVRLKAASWSVQASKEAGHEPTAEEMSAFAQMLLAREKAHKDTFSHPPFMGETVRTSFRIADDRNGHFDVMRVVTRQGRGSAQATRHEVMALRFHRGDIADLFPETMERAAGDVPPMKRKGGRPLAADWEGAILELAGRYYRGDWKPKTIAEVIKTLGDWLASQGNPLSDDTLRPHAKRMFEAFKAWDREL